MTVIDRIRRAERILIVCHIRPDGDCLGAGFSLRKIAENLGKKVDFVSDSEAPKQYSFIPEFAALNDVKYSEYDLGIAVDCGDDARLGKYFTTFKKCKHTINIDHHGSNNYFAKENYVEPFISSTCELVYRLIESENVVDREIATLLYLGLSTDTGNFMHANTTPSALMTASKLLGLGADLSAIVNGFYKNNTKNKLKLISKAIASMRFFHDDEVVVMTVTASDLEQCGCVMACLNL